MGTVLQVKVVPGASRTGVVGRYGAGIKVAVAAPAEKGKANAAVIGVLAEWLGVGERQITLASGAGNPRKVFRIEGVEQGVVEGRVAGL